MRILFLSQIIPFPPDAGPKVKTWHVLQYLASRGHEITLVSFVREGEENFIDNMRAICTDVYTVPIHRSRLRDLLYWFRSLFSGRPFLIERDDIPAMRTIIRELIQAGAFDVIHADQLTMTQFILPEESGLGDRDPGKSPVVSGIPGESAGLNNKTKRIFDAHNAVWTIMHRMQEMSSFYWRPFLSRETNQIKLYEGMIVHSFDHTLAVSKEDRVALEEAEEEYNRLVGAAASHRTRIHVIPIAVNTSGYQRSPSFDRGANILAIGSLHYPPNADGIRWFLRDVFPIIKKQIPQARLSLIGKNPPSDLVSLANSMPASVNLTGYVPDLGPYLETAAVMVVPVRAGGGMRVRILEGMAWRIPMVTTTIGLEGIDAIPDQDILVADDAAGFAHAVCALLQSEDLRARISENGLQLVRERYDWQVVLKELDRTYA